MCGPRGEVLCSLRQNDNRTLWIEVDGKRAGRIERSKDGDVSSAHLLDSENRAVALIDVDGHTVQIYMKDRGPLHATAIFGPRISDTVWPPKGSGAE